MRCYDCLKMKLKLCLIWVLVLLTALAPVYACAADDHDGIIDGIVALTAGNLSLQQWVDGPLCENIGSAMDNYIFCLNQIQAGLDMGNYLRSAAEKLQCGDISNPVTRMRCALVLISCGAISSVPENLTDESIGKMGVMSYVYGLHLLNNGASSQLWTADSIAEKLISLQKEDGGWAVIGNYGDVDVTAMCLQAFSGYAGREKYADSIDRGVLLLSEKQLENGGFASMGRENCESAAQVIIALSSLGIDPEADERFAKNGHTPVDALMEYRRKDGGFAHLPGDEANETASAQALQALLALRETGSSAYDFAGVEVAAAESSNSPLPVWKLWAMAAIGIFAVAGSIFALTRRHGRLKQLIFILLAAGIAAALVLTLNIESAQNYYSTENVDRGEPTGTVYLSIRCDTVAGLDADGSTPEDGCVLERTALSCHKGDTVFDILTDAARKFNIPMEHDGGTGDMAYINGINYLYEYEHGDLSGWLYTVNGVRPSLGCGACAVQDGDEIIWQYTTNIGEDLR